MAASKTPNAWPKLGNKPVLPSEHLLQVRDETIKLMDYLKEHRPKNVPTKSLEPLLLSITECTSKFANQSTATEAVAICTRTAQAIDSLRNDVKIIKNTVSGPAQSPRAGSGTSATTNFVHLNSWAARLFPSPPEHVSPPTSAANLTSSGTNTSKSSDYSVPEDRQITVKIRQDKHKTNHYHLRKDPHILATANDSIRRSQVPEIANLKFIAARQLPSGDIRLTANSQRDGDLLKQHSEWVPTLGEEAHIIPKHYSVIVHGVPVNTIKPIEKNREEIISRLQSDNAVNIKKLKISYVSWLKRNVEETTQSHSSLVVQMEEPGPANAAIQRNLCLESAVYDCVRFERECKSKQCFRCWGYGHPGSQCLAKEQLCGYCAGPHFSRVCPDHEKKKCAACDSNKHIAWDVKCPLKQKDMERMRAAADQVRLLPFYPMTPAQRAEYEDTTPPPQSPGSADEMEITATETPQQPPKGQGTTEQGASEVPKTTRKGFSKAVAQTTKNTLAPPTPRPALRTSSSQPRAEGIKKKRRLEDERPDIVLADTSINTALSETSNNTAGRKNRAKSTSKIRRDAHSAASEENNKENVPSGEQAGPLDAEGLEALCNPNGDDSSTVTCTETTCVSDESVPKRSEHPGHQLRNKAYA